MIQSTPSSPETFYHPSGLHSKWRLGIGWVQQGAGPGDPSSLRLPPHLPRQGRQQTGPGRAAAVGQQRAQKRRGYSRRQSTEAALRRTALPTRGSHRRTVYCVAQEPAPSLASGDAYADLPAQCRGSGAATPLSRWCACPCVRSCVCAHVSLLPGWLLPQACPSPGDLYNSPRLEEEPARGSLHRVSGPFPLYPPPSVPPVTALVSGLGLWPGPRTF